MNMYNLVGIIGLFTVLGSIIYWGIRYYSLQISNVDPLVKDQNGRQHYIHESHILMAGLYSGTECINCGGTSMSSEQLKKLIIPCSMELSVYDGNSKFKHITGETNV